MKYYFKKYNVLSQTEFIRIRYSRPYLLTFGIPLFLFLIPITYIDLLILIILALFVHVFVLKHNLLEINLASRTIKLKRKIFFMHEVTNCKFDEDDELNELGNHNVGITFYFCDGQSIRVLKSGKCFRSELIKISNTINNILKEA